LKFEENDRNSLVQRQKTSYRYSRSLVPRIEFFVVWLLHVFLFRLAAHHGFHDETCNNSIINSTQTSKSNKIRNKLMLLNYYPSLTLIMFISSCYNLRWSADRRTGSAFVLARVDCWSCGRGWYHVIHVAHANRDTNDFQVCVQSSA